MQPAASPAPEGALEAKRQQLFALPGMTTRAERWLLRELARTEFRGLGEVVELGSWLGSLTAALADGMRENPAVLSKGRRVQAFDRFVWKASYMDRYWKSGFGGVLPENNASFLPAFETIMAPWLDLIEVHAGDLQTARWTGCEIEFLSVDAMKTPDLSRNIMKEFYPHLIPGHGYVFHQDFCHYSTWWIHLYHYLLRDHFTVSRSIKGSDGVLFSVVRRVAREDAERAGAADLSDPLLAERAFAFSFELLGGINQSATAAAFEQCELHHGRNEKAKSIRETYALA